MKVKIITILIFLITSFGCMGLNVGGTFAYNLLTSESQPIQPNNPFPIAPEIVNFPPEKGGIITVPVAFVLEYAAFPAALPLGFLGGSVWGTIKIPEARAMQIARNPETPVEKLVELSKDPNPNVRAEVAYNINAPIPIIIKLAKDDSVHVRQYATLSLGGRFDHDKECLEALVEKLSDSSREVRYSATKAIGQFGFQARKTIPNLIKALEDPEAPVRAGAAEALGQIGYRAKEAIPILQKLLNDSESIVSNAARTAIDQISGKETEE